MREPERALASGIPAIRALGNVGMFSPTLVPEEILLDHPERMRAVIVEGSNPLLSYSDAARWREAREQLDLLVVIDPAMTETARLADYVLPTPVGYEKWEIAGFPKGYPRSSCRCGRRSCRPRPRRCRSRRSTSRLARRWASSARRRPSSHELAAHALTPEGAMAFLGTAQARRAAAAQHEMLVWAYRTLGPHLPSPSLVGGLASCRT